jgi:putative addiction module component (TIGR02574 family)
MNPNLQEIKDAVSALSAGERVDLARFVLSSLDEQEEQAVRAEWIALAEERMAEVRSGNVVGVPAEEVLKSLLDERR